LADSGVEVEDFGGNSVIVRAVPADVVPDDAANLVIELADRMAHNPRDTTSEKTQWVLHSIACRAAVKGGDKTHAAQLLRLAEDVLDGCIPPFCPHGRPIVLKVTKKELEKQFGRQG
ncbi:MAG: DNA mismatch repair protein MutL, partial [Ruthenibacterium sp.]